MLTHLHIRNFKSWADTGDVRMAPLTGLFGTNSSGKTAILQFLLMLKQTVESNDQQRILHFGDPGNYVELGTSYDTAYQHQIPGQLSFSLSWKPFEAPLMPRFDTASTTQRDYMYKHQSSFHFDATIDLGDEQISVSEFSYYLKSVDQRQIQVGLRRQESSLESHVYDVFAEGLIPERWEASGFDSLPRPIKSYGFPNESKVLYDNLYFLPQLVLNFEQLFQDIYYLGPLREYPKRTYSWSGESPKSVGQRGELAIAALLSSQSEKRGVEEDVAYWLKELRLIHDFRLQRLAENRKEYEVRVRRNPNSSEVLLTDVGFGVSQILPILVLCYYAPEGSTLILEQPEIHLHPSVQAGLADVFIDVIKRRNVQIIIESHSEHLLHRLQRRIAEEKQQFTNEDTALYFCNMAANGSSELISLELDTFGNISNWPEDFFGDEMGDLVAMTKAAMIRQINAGA